MQDVCTQNAPFLAAFQNTVQNRTQSQTEATRNRDNNFHSRTGTTSLTGDASLDQTMLQLILMMIQMLLTQIQERDSSCCNQDPQAGTGDSDPAGNQQAQGTALDFSSTDKSLLAQALGRDTGTSQASVDQVLDTNASGSLNQADTVVLIPVNTGGTENYSVTDADVQRFMALRSSGAALSLTTAQQTSLGNSLDLKNVTASDVNSDGRLSVGDAVTGFKSTGGTGGLLSSGTDVRYQVMVTQALLDGLNKD
ncbi:MAG: hypothetical protein KDI44_01365 [Thiothrix sp.]|nr:hypothetical protein [Thiothrix sp.]HPQ94108.1 hypothetical protein [Thiolinea sp.]